jgi:nifR3 family TIM-barrel protein
MGGVGLAFTELISCHALRRINPATRCLIATRPDDAPLAMQLFGPEPGPMAAGAVVLAQAGAALIDINMGCPVPKLARTGSGAVLMRDPDRAEAIVAACVEAVRVPVTVKIRAGWDDQTKNACEFARRMADAGAAAITVHARTRAQGYSGRADWPLIAQVVKAVSVPVIGNGDVIDGPTAAALLDETGCAAIMIGRAAMGAPWIFRAVHHYLAKGEILPEPSRAERGKIAWQHFCLMRDLYGERTACFHIRRIACAYARGLPGAREFRAHAVHVSSAAGVRETLDSYFG